MKRYKPTSPSRRNMTTVTYRGVLTESKPHKSLTKGFKRDVGRNNKGRITTRHKGGGNKRLFREVDFKLEKKGIPAKVESVEYDPNRSAFISLVCYHDGERRYILATKGVKKGDTVIVGEDVPVEKGNRLPLKKIPVGTFVHSIELKPLGGAKIIRSAGNYAEVLSNDGGYTSVKMPSSEVRKILENAYATVGEVSNDEHKLVKLGKAGRSRWLGRRPTVRGSAMNPVDHPYGGGEGRAGRGRRRAVSKWGKPTGKGQKTRRAKKYSNRLIVTRRKVGKRR
jgi:large subunit ribosomal protein L2